MALIRRIFFRLILLACVLAISAVGYFFYWKDAPNRLLEPSTLIVKSGAGVNQIAAQLVQAEILSHPLPFKLLVLWEQQQTALKAGEYTFDAGLTPHEVLEKLVKGKVVIHSITVVEGMKSTQVLARLAAAELLTGDLPKTLAEGSVLPETYHYQRGETRSEVIARMQQSMRRTLSELWEARQSDLPLKNKEEALILASIIEKETGVDGERGLVSSVFINRLRRGMKLQSDPTVIYAVEQRTGKPMTRNLFTGDLERDHPYNTYTREGLTPGPIANPGKAAIKAALNPPKSPYLYFVATGTGGHRFAKSLREHNQNVADYRRELRRQGLR